MTDLRELTREWTAHLDTCEKCKRRIQDVAEMYPNLPDYIMPTISNLYALNLFCQTSAKFSSQWHHQSRSMSDSTSLD